MTPFTITASRFVLRTPLLPLEDLLSWSQGLRSASAANQQSDDVFNSAYEEDKRTLRDRLRATMARPEVLEALYVASPTLMASVDQWRRDPESERGKKVERALVRYFVRMVARPTPFGLFAGCSVGNISDDTFFLLNGRSEYRRHTRLDMDYLSAVTDALARDADLREELRFIPNDSLYRVAGQLRYVEARVGPPRTHHLVAIEPTDYLEAALSRAAVGALLSELAEELVCNDPTHDTAVSEAKDFVAELVESQVIVSSLCPPVTGAEPLRTVVEELQMLPSGKTAAAILAAAQESLRGIDAAGIGVSPQQYEAIAKNLEGLPAKVDLSRLFQVDMVKPTDHSCIGTSVIAEVLKGVEIVQSITHSTKRDEFAAFRKAFDERYGRREMPLVEVLDDDVGIGFNRTSEEKAPLLEGLAFPGGGDDDGMPWTPRDTFLLHKLARVLASGSDELELTDDDVRKLKAVPAGTFSDCIHAVFSVGACSEAAVASGDFQVLVKGVFGPSGARLLGRFCHTDPAIDLMVREHLKAEQALKPETVFVEIVHLPEGRVGNVICRPVLRDYELAYLGRSGACVARQITVSDLQVGIEGDRVVLRSKSLGREVVPRLTSAHTFTHLKALSMYRFLGSIQTQNVLGWAGWNWGLLQNAMFLPRVRFGRLVLQRAHWRIGADEIATLSEANGEAARFRAAQKLRAERRLPRIVEFVERDNELPVDFDNALSVETFIQLIRRRRVAGLTEMFPSAGQLICRGPEGSFTHEAMVMLTRRSESISAPSTRTKPQSIPVSSRFLTPGSEWLYFKIYCSSGVADRVMARYLAPLIRRAISCGWATGWFFIRYFDPHWHVRLRFRGNPKSLSTHVLPAVREALEPLIGDGSIWKIQLDTYEREVERYGGVDGIELSERLFQADSDAVLEILELLEGDAGADARWRLTLRSIDMWLCDFGFGLQSKLEFARAQRAQYGREFGADGTSLKHQLGDKYRNERKAVEILLNHDNDHGSELSPALDVLTQRSYKVRLLATEFGERDSHSLLSAPVPVILASHLHMHANRLLRSVGRQQELVLYDFLSRYYESQVARAKRASTADRQVEQQRIQEVNIPAGVHS